MTAIVGIAKDGKVYIGGDSAGVANLDITTRSDEKVFRNNNMIFGFTSSFRMGQLLRYKLKIPKQKCDDDYEYMVTDFIDAVRDCLKKNGYASIENNAERGGDFLVGYKGSLYVIYDDFQVGKSDIQIDAVGCGEKYCLGSMYSTENEKDITKRLLLALESAEKFSGGVRKPFHIVSI